MKTLDHPIVQGLPDLCADIFTYVLQLQRSPDPGDPEALRIQIDELFRALESRAKQMQIAEPHLADAKYAIVAIIDEMILNSDWKVKETWSTRPLQMEYFNSFSAGEEFYVKIENYRNSTDKNMLGVLEVYYTCLSLGFRGMHADLQGLEKLKNLISNVGRELRRESAQQGNRLADVDTSAEGMAQKVKNISPWIVPIICTSVLFLFFLVLYFILGGIAGGVRETLQG